MISSGGSVPARLRLARPLTENGLLRILGHPKYPNSPGPPSIVAPTLVAIRQMRGHHFWPDAISLVDEAFFNSEGLSSHSRVTDRYLLGLARANDGVLATMDRRLAADAVPDGSGSLVFIGN